MERLCKGASAKAQRREDKGSACLHLTRLCGRRMIPRSAFFAEACDKPLLSKVAVESECLSDSPLPHAVKTGDIDQAQLARLDEAPLFKCALEALFSNYDHPRQDQYGVVKISKGRRSQSALWHVMVACENLSPPCPEIILGHLTG